MGTHVQNNEPSSVVSPTDPDLVIAGWNDYCSDWMASASASTAEHVDGLPRSPREEEQDGFDVHQCRELLDDGTYGPDTCPSWSVTSLA
jgi:hypothetical protein